MFPTQDKPRVFAVPPGCDFVKAFVDGLFTRMKDSKPEDMARVEIYLSTRSLSQAVVANFIKRKNSFLPKISLLNDLKLDPRFPEIPPPVSTLRIRLELMQTIKKLLEKNQRFASHLAQYELTRTLETLLHELSEENVDPALLGTVDQTDLSSHWKESLKFLEILATFVKTYQTPDQEARQRLVIDALAKRWEKNPPDHPVIIAGSTGSVGSTQHFMQKVASLPQGALVLPCFDFDLPESVWEKMGGNTPQVDHPQYQLFDLARNLGISPLDIPLWDSQITWNKARNSLISLALRPAPVTNQWKSEGPNLTDLKKATEGLALVEAPTARMEAVTIALQMRKALEEGKSVAVVTPDRSLVRKVRASLRKWGINPQDLRGEPFLKSSHGNFLLSIANMIGKEASPEEFISLLKHPLTNSGPDHDNHRHLATDLEFYIRSKGPEYEPIKQTGKWLQVQADDSLAKSWFKWFETIVNNLEEANEATLEEFVTFHRNIATKLADGPDGRSETLWTNEIDASQEANNLFNKIQKETSILGKIPPREYAELFYGLAGEIRILNRGENTPNLYFWNTEDARMETPDLLIAGGLNEGTWPIFPGQDPWLNRNIRGQIGLNLPETRIGLAAHDFQQVVSAKEVILSRCTLEEGDPTTPSRWLSRLKNLLAGLDPEGISALECMKKRGDEWLNLAHQFEKPQFQQNPYTRPQPSPPLEARPKKISVTRVRTLITDPYAIYARQILRLKPVYRLKIEPSFLLRGIKLHSIMEEFVPAFNFEKDEEEIAKLKDISREILADTGTLPVVEEVWLSTLAHNYKEILGIEKSIRIKSEPDVLEESGSYHFEDLNFTLTAKCDRMDLVHGTEVEWHLFDYKSGAIPTPRQIDQYEKQIPLQTIMAENGSFTDGDYGIVTKSAYIGIGRKVELKEVTRETDDGTDTFQQDWEKFQELIGNYKSLEVGYIPRRYGGEGVASNEYDHLARYGEWEDTDQPQMVKVGDGQ